MTLEELAREMEAFHNHICIVHDHELARLVGVADGGDDFYYIVRGLNPKNEYWATAVGHITSLKDICPEEQYDRMDYVFELNGAERTDTFKIVDKGQE